MITPSHDTRVGLRRPTTRRATTSGSSRSSSSVPARGLLIAGPARVPRMKPIVGSALDTYLARGQVCGRPGARRAVPPLGSPPPALHEAMRYTLLLPGKRLRGILVLASSELPKGRPDDAMPLACAVEMVHASSLILDDLPAWTTRRCGAASRRSIAVGEANAILAAVALAECRLRVDPAGAGAARTARARPRRRALSEAIGAVGLIGGQVADLRRPGSSSTSRRSSTSTATRPALSSSPRPSCGARGGGRQRAATSKRCGATRRTSVSRSRSPTTCSTTAAIPSTTGKDAGLDRDTARRSSTCAASTARAGSRTS